MLLIALYSTPGLLSQTHSREHRFLWIGKKEALGMFLRAQGILSIIRHFWRILKHIAPMESETGSSSQIENVWMIKIKYIVHSCCWNDLRYCINIFRIFYRSKSFKISGAERPENSAVFSWEMRVRPRKDSSCRWLVKQYTSTAWCLIWSCDSPW